MSHPAAPPEPQPSDLTVGKGRLGLVIGAVLALALLVVAAWFMLHPQALPTSDRQVRASTPVGVPVYVAVYPASSTGRTITLSRVHVNAPADSTAEVAAQVCVDGSLSVTSDPNGFCSTIVPVEGTRLAPGDLLMLRIQSSTTGTLELDDLEVSYRDGLQWGTQPVGPRVAVTFLGRP